MITINHVSIFSNNPKKAADTMVQVFGGVARPFPPSPGGYTFYFDATTMGYGGFIEFYPKVRQLVKHGIHPVFEDLIKEPYGYATHINLMVDVPLKEIAARCTALGLDNGIRFTGLLDVWLEEELLIEVSNP